MRRTQLYLEDDLWKALHAEARRRKTTVSDVARTALREKYVIDRERRKRIFQSIVGLWADRDDIGDTEEYIRELRRDTRSQRFNW